MTLSSAKNILREQEETMQVNQCSLLVVWTFGTITCNMMAVVVRKLAYDYSVHPKEYMLVADVSQ